jgi:type VI secretion system protein ImpA
MSQASILDFDALLAPVSEAAPCGTAKEMGSDLALLNAFSSMTMTVQTAKRIESRRQELETLSPSQRQPFMEGYEGMTDGPSADPKWESVAEQALEVLAKHSKDTRIMLYLAEALPRIHGLPGLRDAMRLSRLMLEQYGNQLFPTSETPEEQNYYLQFVARMNDSNNILAAIERTPFYHDEPQLYFYSHLKAIGLEKLTPEDRDAAIKGGDMSLNDFSRALERMNAAALDDFQEQIRETLSEAQQLDDLLGKLSGKEYLGIGNVIEALKKLQRWYEALIEPYLNTSAANSSEGAEQETMLTAAGGGGELLAPSSVASNLQTREQALNSLLKVADFFRKTEPHSPLSYALEQAVRWGRMPLPELLRDLVSNSDVLEAVYKRMGIQENSDKN